MDQILDRQQKLEEQVASFLLTQGDSEDLSEDLIPKPINSEQDFDRFGTELQEKCTEGRWYGPLHEKLCI